MVNVTSSFMWTGDYKLERIRNNNWQPLELREIQPNTRIKWKQERNKQIMAAVIAKYGQDSFTNDEAYNFLLRKEQGDPVLQAKAAAADAKEDAEQAAVIETFKFEDAAAQGKLVSASIRQDEGGNIVAVVTKTEEQARQEQQGADFQIQALPQTQVVDDAQAASMINEIGEPPAVSDPLVQAHPDLTQDMAGTRRLAGQQGPADDAAIWDADKLQTVKMVAAVAGAFGILGGIIAAVDYIAKKKKKEVKKPA